MKTLTRRIALALLAVGALVAGSVHADRVVPGYTLVPVTAQDVTSMNVS